MTTTEPSPASPGTAERSAEARQEEILARARTTGRVMVTELAPELGVSVETVRRDLKVLADRGVVERVYGGAVALESGSFETSLEFRAGRDIDEKHRIARAALQHRHGAETIYIDEGTMPQFLAEELLGQGPATIITPSLPVATRLSGDPDLTVIVLGGRVRTITRGVVDQWATRMLSDLVIDLAYIGANGISREQGLTTQDPSVAAVKRTAIERSRRRIFFGAHTKFGASSLCRFAGVRDFEALITGTELPSSEARRFAALGPRVIRA
ncbi:DeoR/GlpR family transcriptional regulator of sugar metabolism [Nocardioides luteus]|uniref:Lactose phosphotransferase system repressor n=1 Tax=Nocardioides luteus TaxID=1844 RepID=A0ABQ5T384_9ACTN|nr:DeoR/GlpR family DNA-binding transcription regulator [Nocardioides luteus]MDR7309667.1 DeoR/GlpR family transcriptional regulator of sugar metabolism [Nocardioides luteus]GGR70631.1 transcriptional regulator [Nocardioides luteus]GLJ70549.1 transcriptional regulator [Nocardioides luteus]